MGEWARRLEEIAENRRLNLSEQFAQYEILQSRPLHVAIPTGDRCNLRCVFCTDRGPTATWYQDQTFEGFLRFVEPIDRALMVQLYGWGEPFVNPAYPRMFDYVAERFAGTRLYISTNGVLLTQPWVERLLAYGKCLVNISLNAATPQTYALIAGRDLFHRVVSNVRQLTRAWREADASDLVITLSFTATRLNILELPRFIELGDDLDVRYLVLQDLHILDERHLQLFLGQESEEVARLAFLEAAELARSRGIYLDSFMHHPGTYFEHDRSGCAPIELPRDCLSVWDQDDDAPFHPESGECYEPWTTFLVSQSGDVTTCCRARQIMGNLLEQGFEEIWNGQVYRTYRRTINTFRPPQACLDCPVKTGHDIR
jgi:radical SAM protein with 4Fe4S-binding SPASM domain